VVASLHPSTGSPNRSRNRIPGGSGSDTSTPLSAKDAPASVEIAQALKLKLPLGLSVNGRVIVLTKLPESLKPIRALVPHHATLSSLGVLPASREIKSSGSLGSVTGARRGFNVLRMASAFKRSGALAPKVRKLLPPWDTWLTFSPSASEVWFD